MREMADILISTPVISLINAKPMKKKNFIYLDENDSINTALITFIRNEIESVPVKKANLDEFVGIISLVNLLKFVFSAHQQILNIKELLDLKLIHVTKSADLIQKIEFIDSNLSLMHLLLNVWGSQCNPKTSQIDCKHLLTTSEAGKYEIITPLDFLRHLLFLKTKQTNCLEDSLATEIENGFDVDENLIVHWGQDLRIIAERMINSEPVYLLAIVNHVTGTLEANITFLDLLPTDSEMLTESLSKAIHGGLSLHEYFQFLNGSKHSFSKNIDPILLYPHFTIQDLIEKLTRLKIHHLWRVTPDAIQRPIGAVGVVDILRYLTFMFRPFFQENLPDGLVKVQ